ncbi:MAG: GNAT family N-acetyltransferase [Nonlabens sp.]|uniref:GNAT family N-acetyltransferase n=1 Tax=Nonlabens sp. TaxID=1888209 RepID=UPI003EF8340C
MIDYEITAALKDEFPQVLELLKIAASSLQHKGINQWSYWLHPPKEKLEWIQEGIDKNEFYFVKDNSTIIGMYRLMTEDLLYWGKQSSTAYYIHSLVIIPAYSGKQLGTQIIEIIKHQAALNSISFLRLDCDASNLGLCDYYVNQGFQKVGTVQMPLSLNNLYELKVSI